MQSFACVDLRVEKDFVIRNDPNMRGRRSRQGEFEGQVGGRSRGRRRLLRGVRGAMPSVFSYGENGNKENQAAQKRPDRNPLGGRGNWIHRLAGCRREILGASKVVFAQKRLFREAKVPRNTTHETVAKDAARELCPIFIFQGLQEAVADAGGFA